MTNEERWNTFIADLSAYIEEHHHLPDKHKVENRGLLNQVKYARKKVKEGKLRDDQVQELEEILNLRHLDEHTGGRRFRVYGLWLRDV